MPRLDTATNSFGKKINGVNARQHDTEIVILATDHTAFVDAQDCAIGELGQVRVARGTVLELTGDRPCFATVRTPHVEHAFAIVTEERVSQSFPPVCNRREIGARIRTILLGCSQSYGIAEILAAVGAAAHQNIVRISISALRRTSLGREEDGVPGSGKKRRDAD